MGEDTGKIGNGAWRIRGICLNWTMWAVKLNEMDNFKEYIN